MELGGLGVHCVKTRAMAMLIHTFLAQAISPRFANNQYHTYLYKWHVLEERDFPYPGRPPFYSTTFFNLIKDVKENTPLNVAWVSVKQWYQLLLERGVTHSSDNPDAPPVLLKSRLEDRYPDLDLSGSYRLSRVFGLAPEQKSFTFKMLQSLLPTRDRLARIGKVQSSNCIFCDGIPDSTEHLLTCSHSSEVSIRLITCLTSYFPAISTADIVMLNIPVTESMELPVVWLVSICLGLIWDQRVLGKIARLEHCRAELLAKLMLLRDTKWRHYTLHNSAVLLEDMINLHFS